MKLKRFLVPALVLLVAVSCRKSPNLDQLSANPVVATNVDVKADFTSYRTYFISDTVAYVGDNPSDTILTDNTAQQLVATVKQNMTARGYQFVDRSANPDLGINMGVAKITSATTIYPGWWWDYPGWWDPWYWGWYYPYYYPWSVTYIVTTGTVLIDLIDLKNASEDHKVEVVWTAVVGGALGNDYNTNLQRGIDGINQAFTQSPQVSAQ
ncbi:MAG TPA: DUF4136 domain-containing protein [Puia sp.]|nr:DUF4136 domain-containing protein [Puia sp.]